MIHPQGLKSSVSPVAYGFLKKDGYNLVSIGTKENEWLLGRQVMVFAKDVFVKLMLSILVKKSFLISVENSSHFKVFCLFICLICLFCLFICFFLEKIFSKK